MLVENQDWRTMGSLAQSLCRVLPFLMPSPILKDADTKIVKSFFSSQSWGLIHWRNLSCKPIMSSSIVIHCLFSTLWYQSIIFIKDAVYKYFKKAGRTRPPFFFVLIKMSLLIHGVFWAQIKLLMGLRNCTINFFWRDQGYSLKYIKKFW